MAQGDWQALIGALARLSPATRRRLRRRLAAIANSQPHPRLHVLIGALEGADSAPDRRDAEGLFVAKLDTAGRLEPSLLVSALRERRLGIFVAALARLGGYAERAVIAALANPTRPDALGLALAGAGVDRGAFADLLDRVRALNGGLPGGGEAGARLGAMAFGPLGAAAAGRAFRLVWQGAVAD